MTNRITDFKFNYATINPPGGAPLKKPYKMTIEVEATSQEELVNAIQDVKEAAGDLRPIDTLNYESGEREWKAKAVFDYPYQPVEEEQDVGATEVPGLMPYDPK